MQQVATTHIQPCIQQTPPQTIDYYCDIDLVYCYCYGWELAGYEKIEQNTNIPLAITYLDSIDARNVVRVYHAHNIVLSTTSTTYISFDMAINIIGITIAPGPGFRIDLFSQQQQTLFELQCRFRPDSTVCYYFGNYLRYPGYSGASFLATGIVGDVYIPIYNYVEERCVSIEGAGCHYDKRVIGTARGVWIAPRADNGRIRGFAEVDPYDGKGRIEQIYNTFTRIAVSKTLPSSYSDYYVVAGSQLVSSSSSTRYFAIGITPPGVPIAAGIEVGTTNNLYFNYYVNINYDTYKIVYFYPRYYELQSYYIRDAGGYYNVPLPIVWPFTS